MFLPALLLLAAAPQDEAGLEFYETRIRPLLHARCVECHGPEKQRSGLRVDSLSDLLWGGERGPAIEPGNAEASLLVQAVRYDDDELQMPPKSRLSADEIAVLERWIAMGAPAPDANAPGMEEEGGRATGDAGGFDLAARAEHWCFQPIADPPVPAVPTVPGGADEAWPRDDVDRFLLARLEEAGLTPAHDADPAALIRRLSFDLRGLPPPPEEVEAFLAAAAEGPDALDAAYEELVDAYLASPDYGETWARHWLDLMRYAESKGHEFDHTLPNAYQYRDYVIRAFDADVPYDRLLVEHVAGDLLWTPRPNVEAGWDESVLGTGWWFLGEEVHSPVDTRADQVERIANQMDVFGKAYLGLTVSCARCHDHKFDPITQEDYYALAGFSLSTTYRQVRFDTQLADERYASALAERRAANEAQAVANTAAALRPAVDTLAERLLDPDEAMEAELAAAAEHPDDPLFLFARTRGLAGDAFAAALARALAEQNERIGAWLGFSLARDDHQELPLAAGPVPFAVDRARIPPGFLVAGPAAPGLRARVSLGADPSVESLRGDPIAWDPAWNAAELAPGVEREPSDVDWPQAGRTVRTETITLEHPRLFYLVRGGGHAFVEIDGHRMLKGPLHGRTRLSWEADGERLRWIEHDISDYVGHRAHVELSPLEGATVFGLVRVVCADERPPDVDLTTLSMRLPLLGAASSAECAEAIERAARDDVDAFAGGVNGPLAEGANGAWVALLSTHPALGGLPARPFELPDDLAALRPDGAHTAPAAIDAGEVDENLLIRGSARSPGPPVPQRLLEVLGGKGPMPAFPTRAVGSIDDGIGFEFEKPLHAIARVEEGRLELAARMIAPANPLVSRVYVNRVWHHLFGRGIVGTTDNLGISGDRPTHPELLDHLATAFMRDGWSTKGLIKRLVMTRAYRVASSSNPDVDDHPEEVDPSNLLLHKANVRRLTAEKIRDCVLVCSGGLNPERFGPAVPVHLTPFQDGRGRPQSGPVDGDGRRSIYLAVRRNFLSPFLQAFDYPTPATCRGKRSVSNVPAQALALMNDPFVVGEARRWGERVASELGEPEAKLARMVLAAWGRAPDEVELDLLLGYLAERGDNADGWADIAHVLFNGKELTYLR